MSFKVLYVHGFGGSGNGNSAQMIDKYLKETFPDKDIELIAPTIPYLDAKQSVKLIRDMSSEVDLVIASSLGAFYSSIASDGIDKILINPALPKSVKKIYPEMSKEYADYLDKIEQYLELMVDKDLQNETYFIFGTEDDVCNNKDYYKDLYFNVDAKTNHFLECKMGHKLDEAGLAPIGSLVSKYFD